MKVFLDDERDAPPGWILIRDPDELIKLIYDGKVLELSLDNDLGEYGVGKGAVILATSNVGKSLECGKTYFGSPAIEAKLQKRIMVSEKYLPEVVKDYRKRLKEKDKK